MNLRNDHLWLYSRSTGLFRSRAFPEYDPFRDAVFDQELAGEQSVAVMGCLSRQDKRAWWLYAEITLEAERTVGWLDKLPRAGLLVESLAPGVTIDLDFYYSLMDTRVGGPGVLLVVWWSPLVEKAG